MIKQVVANLYNCDGSVNSNLIYLLYVALLQFAPIHSEFLLEK